MSEQITDEIWKDIRDFEGIYQVSNLGRVKSVARQQKYFRAGKEVTRTYKNDRILTGEYYPNGHDNIVLSKVSNGKQIVERRRINHLVAEAFIENPNNYPCVRAIDGDKHNCRVDNLEWVDRSDVVRSKPIICITDNVRYKSAYDCMRKTGISRSTIVSHLNSGLPYKDKIYKYAEDVEK